ADAPRPREAAPPAFCLRSLRRNRAPHLLLLRALLLGLQSTFSGGARRTGLPPCLGYVERLAEQIGEALGDLLPIAMLAARRRAGEREETLPADPRAELPEDPRPLI